MSKFVKIIVMFLVISLLSVNSLYAAEENISSEIDNVELKEDLHKLGFYEGNINDSFNQELKASIEEFQGYHKLSETGDLNKETETKLASELSDSFFYGDRDKEISQLQSQLIKLGIGNWKPTYTFGPTTEDAVKDFQKYFNLKNTGVLDSKTQKKIQLEAKESPQTGDRYDEITLIQESLIELGYGDWSPTSTYGSKTKNAVVSFQESQGLMVNGIFDSLTRLKVEELKNQPLSIGMRNSDVKIYQEKLIKLGFASWTNATEYFGSQTETATKEFQSYHGLSVTGIANEKTEEKLNDELRDSYIYGERYKNIKQFQNQLIKLGIGDWSPTSTFGPTTERAIVDFQRYYNLKTTGVLDTKTQSRIVEEAEESPQRGDRSNEIQSIQDSLIKVGFGSWSPTSTYGSKTEEAVIAFQKSNDLMINGIFDSKTEEKLKEVENKPLSYGMRRPAVKEYQDKIIKLGFATWTNATEYFGSQTETATKEFQDYHGLSVTGVADEKTIEKLNTELKDSFLYGETDNEILELQNQLIKLGVGDWNPTYTFGPTTEAAIINFQRYYNLKDTGIFDTKTQARIHNEAVESPQRGDRSSEMVEIQKTLIKLGFGNWSPTSTYGSKTETAVIEFQEYYGLTINGIFDSQTRAKATNILSSPMQKGNSSSEIRQLQENLIKLGYGNWSVTSYFGNITETALKAFQEDYELVINGIADEPTLEKIDEVINSEIINYTPYNITFESFLNKQANLNPPPQTDTYNGDSAYVSASHSTVKSGTVINGSSVALRTDPEDSSNSAVYARLNEGTQVEILESDIQGFEFNGSTSWNRIKYDGNTNLYVHANLVTTNSESLQLTTNVNLRSGPGTNYHSYGIESSGSTYKLLEESEKWHKIQLPYGWVNAKREDYAEASLPKTHGNFIMQHLMLNRVAGATEKELNSFLNSRNRGELNDQGAAFIEGAKKHNVNEAYLVAHAVLETGHGSSDLAEGVYVDSKGYPTTREKSVAKVFNMYGIGAVDSSPLRGGSRLAFERGWTSPEKAIEGGAGWIAENYIHSSTHNQNTIYKMRWNPSNPGVHQYATDMGWAQKQTNTMMQVYENFSNPLSKHYDIPDYK